jgi:hypothetical protein
VALVPMVGFSRVYQGVGNFTKLTQTLACLEILHAATGKPLLCLCRISLFQSSAANILFPQASFELRLAQLPCK